MQKQLLKYFFLAEIFKKFKTLLNYPILWRLLAEG